MLLPYRIQKFHESALCSDTSDYFPAAVMIQMLCGI